jgi:hypothetical protein
MTVSRICSGLLMVLLVAGGFGAVRGAPEGDPAQAADERYFPETGHWVRGDFLKLYEAAEQPTLVYGYPITEAFVDARSGLNVQYFQRARFESPPGASEGQQVQLAPLGSLFYVPGRNPKLKITNLLACRHYDETGFPVCYAFLDFLDSNGGVDQFGLPISGFEAYNGRIVQYFERARLEWYPELGEGQKVRPADLGRSYFDSIPEDAALLKPVIDSFIPQDQVQRLLTRVFVEKAVTRGTDAQKIYVVVQDQTSRPVVGATVNLTVLWPDGARQTAALTTDKNGLAAAAIRFSDRQPGEFVIVNALASLGDLNAKTSGSFRIWH